MQDADSCLARACRQGSLVDVYTAIVRGASDWTLGLEQACIHGHLEIAKLMFTNGAHGISDDAMEETCKRGHLTIVDLLLRVYKVLGIQDRITTDVLNAAITHCRTDMVKLLVAYTNKTHAGLCYASYMGDMKYFDQLHNRRVITTKDPEHKWRDIMKQAILGGQLHMVKRLLSMEGCNDIVSALFNACGTPYLDIIQYLEFQLPDNTDRFSLNAACRGGHLHVIKYVLSKQSTWNWEMACCNACEMGHLEAAQFIVECAEKGHKDCSKEWDWASILHLCIPMSNLPVVKWVKSQDPNLHITLDMFLSSCQRGNVDYVEYFMSLEPMYQNECVIEPGLLHLGASVNNLDMVKLALLRIDKHSDSIRTALQNAYNDKNLDMVILLAKCGTNVMPYQTQTDDSFDVELFSRGIPLHYFCDSARLDIHRWKKRIKMECVMHMPILPCFIDMIHSFC